MLGEQETRIERQRLGESRSLKRFGFETSCGLREEAAIETDFGGKGADLRSYGIGNRLYLERKRKREVLLDAEPLEENNSFAENPEPVHRSEPVIDVRNRLRERAEDVDVTRIGQCAAHDQVRQDFGADPIESDEGNRLALVQLEVLHAKWPKTVVVLADVVQGENELI